MKELGARNSNAKPRIAENIFVDSGAKQAKRAESNPWKDRLLQFFCICSRFYDNKSHRPHFAYNKAREPDESRTRTNEGEGPLRVNTPETEGVRRTQQIHKSRLNWSDGF